MTAAQTKEHEEDKLTGTGIRKDKIRKVGSKARKQENPTQGVHSEKVYRLCYKAEPGPCHNICDLPHALVGNGIKSRCCRCRAPPP